MSDKAEDRSIVWLVPMKTMLRAMCTRRPIQVKKTVPWLREAWQ